MRIGERPRDRRGRIPLPLDERSLRSDGANADKLVFGIVFVTGIFSIIASFLLELVYGLLDPQIRTGSAR